ncbi:hypothetical protein F3Y22_tig00110348pilonHSYRG00066 [Hibiscus syriacus]|uniref:Uncharacterized protein n=1 Tax=Hibiscus syriacus TaxID=106335 RepID=A0A6A3AZH0_HIBSY|nr:hypothetical protein F3Y22_tig00110348pilonHSYRG00066 [Hibiscus syriacus]
MFIPVGKIEAGRTQYMAATFAVQSFPFFAANEASVAATMPITTTDPIESPLQ